MVNPVLAAPGRQSGRYTPQVHQLTLFEMGPIRNKPRRLFRQSHPYVISRLFGRLTTPPLFIARVPQLCISRMYSNVSSTYGSEATISGTRFTTIYEPDVTLTLSGSTVTACAYDDPGDDDDDDDGQEGSSSAAASSATPTAPAPTVVVNLGFENGTQNPLNSTKSDPNIVAQIATSNDSTPLTAYTGNSYL
jgi:hypothetical protein